MSEWPEVPLGSVTTKVGSGATPRGGKDAYVDAGISLIRSMNVLDGRFDSTDLAHITEDQADRLANVVVEQDDVLLNITGASVARCCLAPAEVLPARVNQHVAIVRLDRSAAVPGFVQGYLVSPLGKQRLLALAQGGATREALTKATIEGFSIPLPALTVQERIAKILGAIDTLIENSRRRIALLEQMAQAIYREWFVHFRYPGHQDDELVDSALGPIPVDWELTTLAEQSASLVDGDWIETKDQGGSDYRLLQVSNIGLGSFRETGNFRFITADTFERLRCTEINLGDILISRMPDPIGRAWLVDVLDSPAVTAVDVAILTPSSPETGSFLQHWLNSPETLAHAEVIATGTTRKRITRSVLGGLQLAMPPKSELSRFHAMVTPMTDAASSLRQASVSLTAMREPLLPRLVTGAIDVSKVDLDVLLDEPAA